MASRFGDPPNALTDLVVKKPEKPMEEPETVR